jgi:hypothetical protein
MIWVHIGLALFFSMIISGIVNLALQYLTGGMYGPFFKKFSPSVFVALTYLFSLGIPLFVAIIFAKQTNLKKRLPDPIPGRGEFILGGLIVLVPQALHIYTSSVQGGGVTFALFSFAGPIIALGKILIFIGAIRLFMAVKPSSEYVYQEAQSGSPN